MLIEVDDVKIFTDIFRCIVKFVEKIHCDVSRKKFRIRSIDPHDFCYIDIVLNKNFFKTYKVDGKVSFGFDVSKFSKILSGLTKASNIIITLKTGVIEFKTQENWKISYQIQWIDEDPLNLPEPLKLTYNTIIDLPSTEFTKLIKQASNLSNELSISLKQNKLYFTASSIDYSFEAESLKPLKIHSSSMVSTNVISNYIKTLDSLINRCENVRIFLQKDKPFRLDLSYLDKGKFTFYISHQKLSVRPKISGRGGTSLPRISMTRFPEFIRFVGKNNDGIEKKLLRMALVETKGGDYTRLGKKLKLVYQYSKKIQLTDKGKEILSLIVNDLENAKLKIHTIALERIPQYKIMIEDLMDRPMTRDEIYKIVNKRLKKEKKYLIDKQDLSTLLGLATWSGALDRQLALYYFGVEE